VDWSCCSTDTAPLPRLSGQSGQTECASYVA
jgi:hypothetical protein